jgi:hypothetical protein
VDKHRELHDMLVTQGAGVEGLHLAGDERPSKLSCERIELAGILWLTGIRGCDLGFEGQWYFAHPADKYGDRHCSEGDTLIDALHAAVKREVGDDK